MVALSPKKSIRAAFCLALAGMCLLAGGLTLLAGITAVRVFHDNSVDEGRNTIERSVLSQLSNDAELLTETLARNLRDPLYLYDFSRIRSILLEASQSESVAYVYLADIEGNLVHDGSREIEVFGESVEGILGITFVGNDAPAVSLIDDIVHVHKPVLAGEEKIGDLHIGMTSKDALSQIDYFGEVLAKDQRENQITLFKALATVFILLLVVSCVLVVWISKKLLAPVYELASRSRSYARGDSDVRFDLQRQDELGVLGLALDDMVTNLSETHSEVWRLAYTDVLTGLPNRRQFHERLDDILETAQQNSEKFAMLFIDLDYFKQINDAYGHDTGDELLKSIASKLQDGLNSYLKKYPVLLDQKHLLSRISGDEFVLVLPITEIADAIDFIESLYAMFSEPLSISGRTIQQTLSTGITYFPHQGSSARELMKNADVAMYEAKKNGRATFCEFNEVLQTEFKRRSLIKHTVSDGFLQHQFFIEYQPIFDIDTTQIKGAEALVRWLHPELGRLWPASFVDVLDEMGRATELALWTINSICEDYKRGCFGNSVSNVCVNITSRTFMDARFHDQMLAMIESSELPSGMLCIEITENNLETNIDVWKYRAQTWKDAGVSIWVDDFGGSSSSLNLLKELPVSALKISSQLIQDIEIEKAQPLIQAIRSFAKALNISVVGMGVESKQQLSLVAEFGCDYAQGFGLGTPLAVEKLPLSFDRHFSIVE